MLLSTNSNIVDLCCCPFFSLILPLSLFSHCAQHQVDQRSKLSLLQESKLHNNCILIAGLANTFLTLSYFINFRHRFGFGCTAFIFLIFFLFKCCSSKVDKSPAGDATKRPNWETLPTAVITPNKNYLLSLGSSVSQSVRG